jgi:hypothetical protein
MKPSELVQLHLKDIFTKRRGLALAVWGEAGIGKSHLVRNVLQDLYCKSLGVHATTSIAELVNSLPTPPRLPVWAEQGITKLRGGDVVGQDQAVQLLATLLAQLAPFVLYLEDLHELADIGWIKDLAQVIKRLKGVALIVSSRHTPPEPFLAFKLEPLGFEAVCQILEQQVNATLPQTALNWIHHKAAGNPLFTLEYFRALAQNGFVWNDGQLWRFREPPEQQIPIQIEALLENTLLENARTDLQKNLLASKAMLPIGSSLDLWANLNATSQTALLQDIIPLERCGVLNGTEFAHPLFREIAQRLFADQQRSLAEAALLRLEDPRQAALFLPFAQVAPPKAFDLLRQAATQASAVGNHAERLRWDTQAVQYAPPNQQAALALSASRDWQHLHLGQALDLAMLACQTQPMLACQTQPNPEALVWLAELQAQHGQQQAVTATLERLNPETKQSLWFLERWLQILTLLGDSNAVLALWDSQNALHNSRNPQMIAQVARAQTLHGHFAKAEALIVSAQQRFSVDSDGHWVLAQSLAHVLHFRGQFAQEEALLSVIIDHEHTKPASSQLTELLIRRGLVRQYLTQLSAAKSDFLQALEFAKHSDNINLYAQAQHGLAIVCACFDERQQAEDYFLASHTILVQLPNTDRIINLENVMAWFYLHTEPPQPRLSLYYAKQAHARAEQLGHPRSRMNASYPLALAYIANNQTERGLELAQNCVAQCRAMPYPQLLFLQLSACGQALVALGRAAEAQRCFAEAMQLAEQSGSVAELEEIGIHQDKLLRDLNSARGRLERLQQLEMWWGVRQIKKNFPELEIQATPAPSPAMIRLLVLGKLQIFRAGKLVALQGNKRQQLLLLLLEARVLGQPELGKLELLEKLYAGKDEKMAASSLKELVRYTRLHLGVSAILTTPRGYCLGDVQTDLEEFLHTQNPDLWRGSYLQGVDSEADALVQDRLSLGLRGVVTAWLETNPQEAARLGQILLKMQPYDLESLRVGLSALRLSQNYKSLERHYQQAQQRFANLGEVLPEHWREFLDPKRQ